MKLNPEVSASYKAQWWVWRVRSDDTRVGDTCLAVGKAKTEQDAWEIAHRVAAALAPIFPADYRFNPPTTEGAAHD